MTQGDKEMLITTVILLVGLSLAFTVGTKMSRPLQVQNQIVDKYFKSLNRNTELQRDYNEIKLKLLECQADHPPQ